MFFIDIGDLSSALSSNDRMGKNSDFYWEIKLFFDAILLQYEALLLRKDYTNGIKYGHLETELFNLEERILQILKSL